MKKVLVVQNVAQKALIEKELLGQMSDGFWENSAREGAWEVWDECEVVVGENVGRNFHASKSNWNFTNKQFLEWQADDMIDIVQEETGDLDYDFKQLRKDLVEIKKSFKTVVAS